MLELLVGSSYSMSLFQSLLRTRGGITSREDFFSEIVAYLFEYRDYELLIAWLKEIGFDANSQYVDYGVRTQPPFQDGRPDIIVELFTGRSVDTIVIESKIDAQEGHQQLRKYAWELGRSNYRKKLLLYITRDFDPKDGKAIVEDLGQASVSFHQARWGDFYRFLDRWREDPLVKETQFFMEELRMAQKNQFAPADVLAMSHLAGAFSMMNETLFGEVSERFKAVVGSVSSPKATFPQLRHKRYLIHAPLGEGKSWSCLLGYWFSESTYPRVGMALQTRPHAPQRETIIEAMLELSETSEWKGYDLDPTKGWPTIRRVQLLNEFMIGEDHVLNVRRHFLRLLDELQNIKSQYAHLPWLVLPDVDQPEDDGEPPSAEDDLNLSPLQ